MSGKVLTLGGAKAPPVANTTTAAKPAVTEPYWAGVRAYVSGILEAGRPALVVFNADYPGVDIPAFVEREESPVRAVALRFERWQGYSPQIFDDRLEEALGFNGGQPFRCVVPFAAVLAVNEAPAR